MEQELKNNGPIQEHSHDQVEGHSHSHGGSSQGRKWVSVLTGAVIAIVFILYMITFTVHEGQYCVLKTFGRITQTIDKPGLYWKWPLAQRAVIHDGRLHTSEDGMLEQTFTKDGQPVMVMTFFSWRIADVDKFDTSLTSFENAEKKLQTIVRSAKTETFGLITFGEFITPEESGAAPGERKLRFDEIEKDILGKVKNQALNDFGVEIKQVGIKRLNLPESVSQKVFDRMKAERDAKARNYITEGEGEAKNIVSRAKRDKAIIESTAFAKAKLIRAEGEKEAAQYYKEFAKEPELHKFIKSLEALRLLAEKTTLIIDTSAPPFHLLGKGAVPKSGSDQSPETNR